MEKSIKKNGWIKLLKRDLIKMPEHDDGEHKHEFTTPENLIVTVTTKNKNRRNYTFGGPVWSATLNFSQPKQLKIFFLSPLKKNNTIKWDKVKEMTFHYLST